eukprot:5752139-Amphidinium_carterae.1
MSGAMSWDAWIAEDLVTLLEPRSPTSSERRSAQRHLASTAAAVRRTEVGKICSFAQSTISARAVSGTTPGKSYNGMDCLSDRRSARS